MCKTIASTHTLPSSFFLAGCTSPEEPGFLSHGKDQVQMNERRLCAYGFGRNNGSLPVNQVCRS